MGTLTARALRGFAVHDARVSLSTLTALGDPSTTKYESLYTQGDPTPGSPVPVTARSFILPHAHAGQGADLDLQLIRGGEPGIDTGAGWLYRPGSSTDDDEWRGWNEPNLVCGYFPVIFHEGGTESWAKARCVALPSSQKVVAIAVDTDATARVQVSASTWDPATRAWSAAVEVGDGVADQIAAMWVHDDTERIGVLRGTANSRLCSTWYSDDDGATWGALNDRILDAGATALGDSNSDQAAAAVDRHGNVLAIICSSATPKWYLYASSDRGATFTETANTTSNVGTDPKILRTKSGALRVFYLDASNYPTVQAFDDAYDTPSATTVTVDATASGGFAVWEDHDGILYLVQRLQGLSIHRTQLHRSLDEGSTWEQYDAGPSLGDSVSHYWTVQDAAPSGGGAIMLHGAVHLSVTSGTVGSLHAVELGGWCNVEHGPISASGDLSRPSREAFGYDSTAALTSGTWVASCPLQLQGWATVGTASTTFTSAGAWSWSPSAATSGAEYTYTYPGNVPHTFEFRRFACTAGGDQATLESAIEIRIANGSLEYMLAIQADTAGFQAYDIHGAANFGTAVVLDMTEDVDFKVSFETVLRCRVWYKRPTSDVWINVHDGTLTDKGGSYSANNGIRVGCLATTTSTTTLGAVWFVASGTSTLQGLDVVSASSSVSDLDYGKSLGARPYGVRDQGDSVRRLRLTADGGGGHKREQFSLPAIFEHGVDRMLPDVSPRVVSDWRTSDLTEQIVAFELAAVNTVLDGSFWYALALVGINWRTAYLETLDDPGSGSWVTLATVDAAVGFTTLTFARSGNMLRPTGATASAARFLQAMEARGGHVILDPSGTPEAHEVKANTGGIWSANTTVVPTIRIADDDIDGSTPTTGTMHLVMPRALVTIPQAATGASSRWIRLRIAASQDVPHDHYRVGQMVLGSFVALGRQWGRGWSMRYEPIVDVVDDDYGTLYTEQQGPLRRELTVSWQDGYDLTDIRSGDDDLAYLGQATFEPLAADGDVWFQAVGLLTLTESGELPAVAVMAVPDGIATTTDWSLWFIGTLSGRLQVNHVLGDEGASELVRVESLTLREVR